MTVFAVLATWWDTTEFVGVYRSREAAEAAGQRFLHDHYEWFYEIFETEVV